MDVEITLHRIGGQDGPRLFGPWTYSLTQGAIEQRDVRAQSDSRTWMNVRFGPWEPVNDEWLSCRIDLMDMCGCPLGTRPAMVYRKPFDVPTYTLFQNRWPEDYGVFSLGLRMLHPV